LSQKTLNPLVKTCKYFSLTGKRNLIQNLKTNYSLNLNLNTSGNNIINNNGFKLQKLTYHQLSKENAFLNKSLLENDPKLFDIIEKEKKRQYESINLIPSENYTSAAVLEALGSVLQNKYSEGYPGARYYGGNQYIDMIENICKKRALEAFNLDPEFWGVNVQALSGTPANMSVYTALLNPHDRIMGLSLSHGGHLSHGHQTVNRKVSGVSKFFETMPYYCNEKTGLIDYDQLEVLVKAFKPKLIVAGSSAYSRNFDYERMKKIAKLTKAYLMADIAHVSGMIAAGYLSNPFEFCDVVTTTTHKSLRGPRGALIFYRKGVRRTIMHNLKEFYDLEKKINMAVFPQLHGGPHNNSIAALAVALKQVKTESFKKYQGQVLKNCKVLENEFKKMGYKIVSDGTDTHLLVLNLKPKKIDGARVEKVLEKANISTNKNTIPGDKSAILPSGLRMGSPAMTSRELKEEDFKKIAEFVDRGIKISIKIHEQVKGKLRNFKNALNTNTYPEIEELKKDVIQFSRQFPVVGFDINTSRYCKEN
jgi:glycine hydroxymethyltransferase